jgi:hypothetical protein
MPNMISAKPTMPSTITPRPYWVCAMRGLVLYLALGYSCSQCEAKRYRTDAEQIVEDEAMAACG